MQVFVTGGTGLVGSHVVQSLCRMGHTVRALVRDHPGQKLVESLGAEAVFGSVYTADAWNHAAGADAIVHSAAIITQRRDWNTFQATNVEGARNAALTAARQGIRLVHLSSVAVYGRSARFSGNTIDETSELAELAETEYYARSKRAAENAISAVVEETGLSAISLRPCVIYGERDRTFLPHVVRILKHGYAPLVGAGTNSLSVVYAGNVAEAVVSALERPEVTGPVNVTNDGNVSQREFMESVGMALDKRLRFVRVPVPAAFAFAAVGHAFRRLLAPHRYAGFGLSAVRFLSNDNPYRSERARTELDWHPTSSPAEAIQRSVHWFVRTHAAPDV